MSFAFNPQSGLIIVRSELEGPSGTYILRLALDTGATGTLVNQARLTQLGYNLGQFPAIHQISTGSGVEFAARVPIIRITALGQERTGFPLLSHTLPPSVSVDGLLGLDFFRGQVLSIDFRAGHITLS